MRHNDADDPRFDAPLDEVDPRFSPAAEPRPHHRALVAAEGPFPDPDSASARFARLVIPAMAAAGLLAVAIVFVAGLSPGSGIERIGDLQQVRAAVAQRPHRVCYEGAMPCAWLTIHEGDLIALNTSGPVPEEYGRAGVGWCPTSGRFGSNSTGSRYDAAGMVVAGPAPRGLDRYRLIVADGTVSIDYFSLQTGVLARHGENLVPGSGPDCQSIPFDRDADLQLVDEAAP